MKKSRKHFAALIFFTLVCGKGILCAADLSINFFPQYDSASMNMGKLNLTNKARQTFSVTRLDFLVSDLALRRSDRTWFEQTNFNAFVSIGENRSNIRAEKIPAGDYDKIRFHVGLRPEINHSKPEKYPSNHSLNPVLNGLHWGWAGGYVFFAIEGNWETGNKKISGYSFHLGNDWQLMTVEIPVALNLETDHSLELALNLDSLFVEKFTDDNSSTHSREGDDFAIRLKKNVENAFSFRSSRGNEALISPSAIHDPQPKTNQSLLTSAATKAKPYRFTFSAQFPIPDLPRDNPLTEEGVELGRRLFNETLLSVNGKQSCASCHQAESAFADPGQRFSTGAKGIMGTRNSMPIFNLAWKKTFFWDGRASSLREQVLQPIQNPIEMHETLERAVAKLTATGRATRLETISNRFNFLPLPMRNEWGEDRGEGNFKQRRASSPQPSPPSDGREGENRPSSDELRRSRLQPTDRGSKKNGTHGVTRPTDGPDYPREFEKAFGSREITTERIARALEQFLLAQVSFDSKFDRAMDGKETLSDEEKRGFQLFSTEYDPRREQFGADCFHCHGGPLFQSQSFANNGLDSEFIDLGRFDVTKKPGDKGKFSVPSLRNIAVTAPYMHDGRFKNLEEVIEHYASGIKRSDTLDPNLAKHPEGGVPLSEADRKALVAFLKTLTDEKYPSQKNVELRALQVSSAE